MNKSETQKYVQGLQKENKELNERIFNYEEKMQKAREKYEKFLKENSLNSEIDKIARDIRERQDNDMAMEFTRTIAELLRKNGIVVHCTEHSYTKDSSDKSIEKVYGVVFDNIDCTKHDKPFEIEIAKLKHDLEESKKKTYELEEIIKRHNFKDTKEILKENEELKSKISELEPELSVKDNLLKAKNELHEERTKYEKTMEELLNYEPTNTEDDIAQFNYRSFKKYVSQNRQIKPKNKPHIHIIGLREFGGEQYMRYSDVEDLIKELES